MVATTELVVAGFVDVVAGLVDVVEDFDVGQIGCVTKQNGSHQTQEQPAGIVLNVRFFKAAEVATAGAELAGAGVKVVINEAV